LTFKVPSAQIPLLDKYCTSSGEEVVEEKFI
jgi:hypothetical protein